MRSKLWKKICNRIKIIVNEKGKYEVQIRDFYRNNRKYKDWHYLNSFDTIGAAIRQKHLYIESFIFQYVGIKNAMRKKRSK